MVTGINIKARSRVNSALLGLGLISLFGNSLCAFAAVSPADVVTALEKAEIVEPGTPLTAKIEHEEVVVSTYKNRRGNDNDCKIDAVLIARKVMETCSEEVTRVSIYFYNTTLTKYKQVTVTAGDVKAFASGAMTKDQLISSLALREGAVNDTGQKLSGYLDSSSTLRANRPIQTRITGNTLEVTTAIEPWVGDRDLKLEALRIADRASEVSSPSVQKIKISFVNSGDPNKVRQVLMDLHTLTTIQNNIQSLLQPVEISASNGASSYRDAVAGKDGATSGVDVQNLDALPGYRQPDRSALLDKIKELDKIGVGVVPFVDSFLSIEEKIKNGEENLASEEMVKLDAQLEEQVKVHKLAKEFKPEPVNKKPPAPAAATPPPDTGPSIDGPADFGPVIARNVLADHKTWMAYYVRRWYRGTHKPEDFPNYLKLLQFFGTTLRKANRIPEAEIYEKQAAEVKKHQATIAAAKKSDQSEKSDKADKGDKDKSQSGEEKDKNTGAD